MGMAGQFVPICPAVQDMAAFLKPLHGTVTVDGVNLNHAKLDSYRSQLGLVLQDTFLVLTNDYGDPVRIKLYFINGDPPLAAE